MKDTVKQYTSNSKSFQVIMPLINSNLHLNIIRICFEQFLNFEISKLYKQKLCLF